MSAIRACFEHVQVDSQASPSARETDTLIVSSTAPRNAAERAASGKLVSDADKKLPQQIASKIVEKEERATGRVELRMYQVPLIQKLL